METKSVAQFEKNKLNDILTNINKLMDFYKELKCDKDKEDLIHDKDFQEENRKLAENTYFYYNNLLKNDIPEDIEEEDSLDDEESDLEDE